MNPQIKILVTSFSKEEQATEIVRTLVREQLVACGTLIRDARSIYVWEGKLEDVEEVLVILKTTIEAAPAAAIRLQELHPYDVPEILVLSPESANASYGRWIRDSLAD